MVGRENEDIKKDERDNWTVAAVSPKRILLPGDEEKLTEFVNWFPEWCKKCVSLNVFGFHHTLGCFHINTETYVSMYSSIKYMNKASAVFRVYRAPFLSGSTQYLLLPPQPVTR